jgi:hypothetical protein
VNHLLLKSILPPAVKDESPCRYTYLVTTDIFQNLSFHFLFYAVLVARCNDNLIILMYHYPYCLQMDEFQIWEINLIMVGNKNNTALPQFFTPSSVKHLNDSSIIETTLTSRQLKNRTSPNQSVDNLTNSHCKQLNRNENTNTSDVT